MDTEGLSMADILAIAQADASAAEDAAVFTAIESAARKAVGFRLFTILKYVDQGTAVERVHSSEPAAYPIGGRKTLATISMDHGALDAGQVLLAANRKEVRETYPDHDLIFSLGITAILSAPIRHAGRRLGTLVLSGEEGMYGMRAARDAEALAALAASRMRDASA